MSKMKNLVIDQANQQPHKDCNLLSAKYYQIYRATQGLEYVYCSHTKKDSSCIQMIYNGGSWIFGPKEIGNQHRTIYHHGSGTTEFKKEN
jgi:hypothetical protein